jgi:hypothetical protein
MSIPTSVPTGDELANVCSRAENLPKTRTTLDRTFHAAWHYPQKG